MIDAVVFDFDGTLTELTLDFGAMKRAVVRIAEKYVSPAAVRRLDGMMIIEMIYELEGMIGDGAAFRDEAFAALCGMEAEAASGKDVYPYTRDVLRALKGGGMKVGVITRNCKVAVESVFPDIAFYVDAVVTRDHVREVKPNPRHVEAVLSALAVRADCTLLVGDHPTDVAAGRAAHVHTAGVLAGRTKRADLETAGAEYILADIRAVPGIVRPGA